MDIIPVELWLKILSYACTDEGSTGRNVSLVCRQAETLVKPYRYQSLGLQSPKQILRFLYLLQRSAADNIAAFSVSHLLITSPHPHQCPPLQKSDWDWMEIVDNGWLSRLVGDPSSVITGKITIQHVEKAVDHILEILSPVLVTLSLHLPFLPRKSLLPNVALPRLEQFLTYGVYLHSREEQPVFDRLRYLHISTPITTIGRTAVDQIAYRAPKLVELFLPDKTDTRREIKRGLGLVLTDDEQTDSARVVFPPSLSTIYLDAEEQKTQTASQESLQSTSGSDDDGVRGNRLQGLQKWAEEMSSLSGVTITVVPRPMSRWDSSSAVRLDWEERVACYFGMRTKMSWRLNNEHQRKLI